MRYNTSFNAPSIYSQWENSADGKRSKREARWVKIGMPVPTRPCPERCECCGKLPGPKALALDHDKATGKFRGWLCLNCNTGLGNLGDDTAGLLLALDYLKRA